MAVINKGIMACAQRKCVYAIIIGLFACLFSRSSYGKGDGMSNAESSAPAIAKEQFQWHDHSRLSWDDFKGPALAAGDGSAAVTYCGIGIKTNTNTPGSKPGITVYNTFNTQKSWVRPDARIESILAHEQGHFDLCEIYTRKLRERLNNCDLTVAHARQTLMAIYTEVNKEYESRQQAYEQETVHGTNIQVQKKWLELIGQELSTIAGL